MPSTLLFTAAFRSCCIVVSSSWTKWLWAALQFLEYCRHYDHGGIATNHMSRKATHLTANEYVLIFLCTVAYRITELAHRYNWLNLSFLVSGPYLTHVGQWNGWGSLHTFLRGSIFWSDMCLAWTYSSRLLLCVAMRLAEALPVFSPFVSFSESVKVPSRQAFWLSVRCSIRGGSTRLVLVIGVRTVISRP